MRKNLIYRLYTQLPLKEERIFFLFDYISIPYQEMKKKVDNLLNQALR